MRIRCQMIGVVVVLAAASCGAPPDTSTRSAPSQQNAAAPAQVAAPPPIDVHVSVIAEPAKVGDPSPLILLPLWSDVKHPVEMSDSEAKELMQGQYTEIGPAADGTRRFTRMDLLTESLWVDTGEVPKLEVVDSVGASLGWFTLDEISGVYTDEQGRPIPRPAK
jgi:hypothetical protein